MGKLDLLKQLHRELLMPKALPGMKGTIGRPSDLIPVHAAGQLKGYWKNVKHKPATGFQVSKKNKFKD
jgi:hypothetical protein|tara:strand:- start:463 stop:666 length:204 start_codon:yes stop_codon:yes gene_type:complete